MEYKEIRVASDVTEAHIEEALSMRPDKVTVQLIGVAVDGIEAGILIGSFNAG